MGEFLEMAKVMVQPTMKLLEMCSNAIGTVYEPRHIRKIADAEAYKIKQLSAAITESDNLPIAYENGNVSMSTVNFEDFVKRAEFRANYQMLREQNNIESIVGKAYQELIDVPEVPADPVDEDWTTRFFNTAKEIHTEEMQFIWGKILAGEVQKPGSYSLRTLDAVRNLTKEEASLFQRLASFILKYEEDGISDYFILSNENSKDDISYRYGFDYADFVKLEEAQLVSADTDVAIYVVVHPGKKSVIEGFGHTIVCRSNGETLVTLSQNAFFLTAIGAELLSIVQEGCKPPLLPYFEDCCHSLRHVAKIEPDTEAKNLEIQLKVPCAV